MNDRDDQDGHDVMMKTPAFIRDSESAWLHGVTELIFMILTMESGARGLEGVTSPSGNRCESELGNN